MEKSYFIDDAVSFDDVLLMPQKAVVNSRSEIDISVKLFDKFTLRVPFVSANMSTVTGVEFAIELSRLGGLPVLHRFWDTPDITVHQVKQILLKTDKSKPIGFSVGLRDWEYVCEKLLYNSPLNTGKDRLIVFFDIAHAHSEAGLNFLRNFVTKYPEQPIVFGNVANPNVIYDIERMLDDNDKWFSDNIILKASIAGGSNCSTAIETGFGVPTLQAVLDLSAVPASFEIMADGGIKNSGDIVKSIWAGAQTVMLGSLFAGTDETPGEVVVHNGEKFKIYRGSASFADKKNRGEATKNVEGVERLVSYKGSLEKVVNQLEAGLRSGISYAGGSKLTDLRNVKAYKVSQNGFKQARPFGLEN